MRCMTLDDLVRDLCAAIGDTEAKLFYTQITRLAIHAIDSLNLRVIPNFRSTKGVVESNLTVSLPEDCIKVAKAAKYLEVGGSPCVYPLGRSDDADMVANQMVVNSPQDLNCPETPPTASGCDIGIDWIGYNGSTLGTYYMGSYYGEQYGYSESRFFGLYVDDRTNNRLVFPSGYCISEGDWVLYTYKSTNEDQKFQMITIDLYPMIRHRVLGWFWENTDPGKSMNHFRKFRMELREYKRMHTSRSYDDILDSITRGYQTSAR